MLKIEDRIMKKGEKGVLKSGRIEDLGNWIRSIDDKKIERVNKRDEIEKIRIVNEVGGEKNCKIVKERKIRKDLKEGIKRKGIEKWSRIIEDKDIRRMNKRKRKRKEMENEKRNGIG